MKINPVCYMYTNKNWQSAIKQITGFIDTGSYSDISDLESLGICGVNWAIGYTEPHTKFCKVDINEYLITTEKFYRFYEKNKNILYPHFQTFSSKRSIYWLDEPDYFYSGSGYKQNKSTHCEYCGAKTKTTYSKRYELNLCSDCLDYWNKEYKNSAW